MRFAYADPPYYGQGKKLYGSLHPEAHIWDDKQSHLDLIAKLDAEYDGWAYSCNPADLSWILNGRDDIRVCAWTKTFHQIRPLASVQYAWEPVLICNPRKVKNRKPMVRDWMACARAMRKGLVGAKPDAFNVWVLDLLGYDPAQDTITEIFVGTNGMERITQTYEAV